MRHPLFREWAVTPARAASGRTAAVSGNFAELTRAAARGVTAERAVFVMHYPDSAFLSDADRDTLWDAFQVPVLACLLDGDGRLVGYECEAQSGLHVGAACPDDKRQMMISSEDSILGFRIPLDRTDLEKSPCECGRPGQRLRFRGTPAESRPFESHPIEVCDMEMALATG